MNLRLPLTAAAPIPVAVVPDAGDWIMIVCAVLSVAIPLILPFFKSRAERRNRQPATPERPNGPEAAASPRLIEVHRYIPPDVLGNCMSCCWCCRRRSWPINGPGCSR